MFTLKHRGASFRECNLVYMVTNQNLRSSAALEGHREVKIVLRTQKKLKTANVHVEDLWLG